MSTPTPSGRCATFSALPAEVRIRVFHFLFDKRVHLQRPGISPTGITIGGNKALHIAPLLVSKQFRAEGIVEYLRSSILCINDELDLLWTQRELKALFGDGVDLCEHVRRIEFTIRWSGDAMRYIQFLGQCPNLKEVTLKVEAPLPLTANLISWTFHLHLLEVHVRDLEAFNLFSVLRPNHVLLNQLQHNLREKLLANKSRSKQ